MESVGGVTQFGAAKLAVMQLCHVVSHKRGGPAEVWNLRPGCAECNGLMGPENYFDFVLKYKTPISKLDFWINSCAEHRRLEAAKL
jgi:hypothetical protein